MLGGGGQHRFGLGLEVLDLVDHLPGVPIGVDLFGRCNHRGEVALEIGFADCSQAIQRDVEPFLVAQHAQKQVLAQRVVVVGRGHALLQKIVIALHGRRVVLQALVQLGSQRLLQSGHGLGHVGFGELDHALALQERDLDPGARHDGGQILLGLGQKGADGSSDGDDCLGAFGQRSVVARYIRHQAGPEHVDDRVAREHHQHIDVEKMFANLGEHDFALDPAPRRQRIGRDGRKGLLGSAVHRDPSGDGMRAHIGQFAVVLVITQTDAHLRDPVEVSPVKRFGLALEALLGGLTGLVFQPCFCGRARVAAPHCMADEDCEDCRCKDDKGSSHGPTLPSSIS